MPNLSAECRVHNAECRRVSSFLYLFILHSALCTLHLRQAAALGRLGGFLPKPLSLPLASIEPDPQFTGLQNPAGVNDPQGINLRRATSNETVPYDSLE